jgi:diguanylate cyclase (GGDEF)-like protein
LKIEEVRTSFTVYLIASELKRLDGIAESLRLAGYMAASFSELTAAFSEFPSNPPHFLIFDAAETKFQVPKAIRQVRAQLPESHIFALAPVEQRTQYVSLLEQGVYDIIYTPLSSPVELLRALDRAAERDYFMYLNERLAESTEVQQAPAPAPTEVTHVSSVDEQGEAASFARRLFEPQTTDACLQVFLRETAIALGRCGGVYFKYIANRRVLMANQAVNLEHIEMSGVGVDLNEKGSAFKSAHLKTPAQIPQVTDMISEVFGTAEFMIYPIEVLGEVQGLVVFLHADPGGMLTQMLADWLSLTGKALSLIESERRLHATAIKDPVTELLNRGNFSIKVQQEVARARRTNQPVSLLVIALDQYGQIATDVGGEEAGTMLRMVARILEKHSRVNDILGRIGNDEFGILLPHTGREGAMVKAERLRRLLHSADFSKVLHAYSQVTISIGVSEYPTLVRDAEELSQSADEALFAVRKQGNKTCVAQAPQGFTPDFPVPTRAGP